MQDLLSSYSKSDSEVDNQLMEMQVSLTSEQCQRMELTAQLSEANNQIQRLQLDKTHLSKDLDLLKDSSGEQSKQVSQWSLALEVSIRICMGHFPTRITLSLLLESIRIHWIVICSGASGLCCKTASALRPAHSCGLISIS